VEKVAQKYGPLFGFSKYLTITQWANFAQSGHPECRLELNWVIHFLGCDQTFSPNVLKVVAGNLSDGNHRYLRRGTAIKIPELLKADQCDQGPML
jgi:hypothetical protein